MAYKRRSTKGKKSPDFKDLVKRLKKLSTQEIVGLVFLVLLIVGGLSTMVLVRTNSDLRNQASTGTYPTPTPSGPTPTTNPSCNPATHCCNPTGCEVKVESTEQS